MMTARTTSRITAATGGLLILALLAHLTAKFTAVGQAETLFFWRQTLLILATILAGIPIAMKALAALRWRAFSIELLVTIAVVGALFIGEYVESAAVTFLFLFGNYLEVRTLERTRRSLQGLIDMAPQEATVIRDGAHVRIAADDIVPGESVIIRSGEKVAIDGPIVSGQATLIEAAITGESRPVRKTVGDTVLSSTIVENGYLEVRAEKVGDDTTFARIIELVEDAQETKSPTQKFLDRFAQIYTPTIVVLSILVYLFTRNIEMTLTFLVVACPGALVISAPVSLVAGIGNGARRGVLIKGGQIMEDLGKVDTVVFDKTGTLTKGRPEVTQILVTEPAQASEIGGKKLTAHELLALVATLEQASEHHLGQTIVNHAKTEGVPLETQPENPNIVEGKGLTGIVHGKHVAVGNRKLMDKLGVTVSDTALAAAVRGEKLGHTAVLVSIDGTLAGIIFIADEIRDEAFEAIAQLRRNGVKWIVMLTGDNEHTARLVGEQLGLDEVHAGLLPHEKVEHVRRLQSMGRRVTMAGDGINDAPAIATADVGLAMGAGGTDISLETADVVLMADRLDQFAHAVGLARATVRNMRQNTFFAVGTVVLLLAGVLLGRVFLASGMLIHELSVLGVILNALRLVNYNGKRGDTKQVETAKIDSAQLESADQAT